MKLLRNPDVKRELLIFALTGLVFTVIGFFLSVRCGVLMLAFCAVNLCTVFWFVTRRYHSIASMAEQVGRVLHGQEESMTGREEEGELAILSTEIGKMTVRLKEQSDRLTEEKVRLTEAIQDMFHQIRTPLTGINLTISLLQEEDLTAERRTRLTRDLSRQSERIRWLVETLLKLSKIDAGTAVFRPETIPADALIEQAAAPIRIPMELRDQTLRIRADGTSFFADPAWTAEAISNLLKNCMEHTPPGGRIDVAARDTALFTELTVTDSGPGFDPEDIPHLFERFYKGKNATPESVGIGLALARSVIAAQNGTITAANTLSGGACFTIRFYKSVV
ncbi:MAG: HAMP domain-containing histidine kinase [Clostridia bacterium]|nr:HAMP domain-containing histidine kinase [Clostridia bacterium]